MTDMQTSYRYIASRALANPDVDFTFTLSFPTVGWGHKYADEAEMYAFRLGLKVERVSSRGWINRNHVLRMRGPVSKIKQFLDGTWSLWS